MNILRVALSTKFTADIIDNVLEVLNNTPNPEYAAELLLGINASFTSEQLLEIKHPSIILEKDSLPVYKPWSNEVNASEMVEKTIDVYVLKSVTNPTLEDAICIYSSKRNEKYPELPTYNEYDGDKNVLRNVYVKTGESHAVEKRYSFSSWSQK